MELLAFLNHGDSDGGVFYPNLLNLVESSNERGARRGLASMLA
jgi:hypothetical protein